MEAAAAQRPGRTAAALLTALTIALSIGVAMQPAAPASAALRLDPSTATTAELAMLPGVGPALARAIVTDRLEHGPVTTVAELQRVKGIGPARLAAMAPWLREPGTP